MTLLDVERAWRALLLAREPTLMDGADEKRQRVYRRLVRGNLSGSVRRGVPILRKLAGEDVVDALITRFLDEVAPKTRLVRFIPIEFAQWLMDGASEIKELPHASAGELAHWEALEIDVIMAPDAAPSSTPLSLALSDGARVEMHPSARLAAYRHAVHTLTPSSTAWPTTPRASSASSASTAPSATSSSDGTPAEPFILLAFRSAEKLTWQQLDGGTAKVILETSTGKTIGEALSRVRAALTAGDALDEPRVRASLVDLCRRGAILGFTTT